MESEVITMECLKRILEFICKTIVWYCMLSLVGFTCLITCISPTYGMIVLVGAIIITITGDMGELLHKKFGNSEKEE